MRKAEDLIQRFLDTIGQSEGSAYVGLFRSWQPIVGEQIAAHSQPVDVKGHTLVIEADHPGWVQMVMMKRGRIIDELTRRFPQLAITGLAVRVVERLGAARPGTDRPPSASTPPLDASAADSPVPKPPHPPSRDEKEALERIEDDELRETLARLRTDLDVPRE